MAITMRPGGPSETPNQSSPVAEARTTRLKKFPGASTGEHQSARNRVSLFARVGEARRHGGECRLQLAADRIDRGDNGHGNASSNQTVFDSGGTGRITQELHQ